MPTDPATVPPTQGDSYMTTRIEPLTDAEVAAILRAHCCASAIVQDNANLRIFDRESDAIRAAYALAASRVDTAEVERRAASKALAECAAWLGKGESQPVRFDEDGRFLLAFERVNAFSDRYLAREHPAPAPRECVPTLADLVEECNATKSDDGRPFERAVVAALDAIAVRVARLAAEVGQ